MTMNRRLSKIETTLKANEKYKNCELEIQPGVEDEPTTYFCRYSDGHKELITDKNIIDELADIPGDGISVVVVE